MPSPLPPLAREGILGFCSSSAFPADPPLPTELQALPGAVVSPTHLPSRFSRAAGWGLWPVSPSSCSPGSWRGGGIKPPGKSLSLSIPTGGRGDGHGCPRSFPGGTRDPGRHRPIRGGKRHRSAGGGCVRSGRPPPGAGRRCPAQDARCPVSDARYRSPGCPFPTLAGPASCFLMFHCAELPL